MTTMRSGGRDWTLYGRYRRVRWGWKGLVYWNPDWVAMHLDGVGSRLAWSGYALTEKTMRRRMARALRRVRRANERADDWFGGGRRA